MTASGQLNIAERFLTARVREGRGGRVALRLDGGDLTYAEVDDLADRYASRLRHRGVRPEERVLILLDDGPDFVGALFGILKVGAVAVMVNPYQSAEAIAAIIEHARARWAIVAPASVAPAEGAAGQVGTQLELLVVGGTVERHESYVVLPESDGTPAERTHRDDPAIWLFSGGTTGRPKAVVQTHRSFANTTELYTQAVGYREDDVTLSVPKLFFGYATGCNLFFPFSVGASAVLFGERATPAAVLDRVERHGATILVNVPSMMQAMLDDPTLGQRDLSSLRFTTSAGEALPPALHQRWSESVGVEVLDGLGTAEMWHIFVSNLPGEVRPGTLGRPVPGFEVEVRDDSGAPVPRGEVGYLWVAGDSRAIGYWRDLDRTANVFRGRWVVTGDLVTQDADGYVRYVGRGDDAIKVKGRWLVPAEVEGVLGSHPEVTAAVVVGVPNDAGLIRPVAFVTVAHARDDLVEELHAWADEHLDSYKRPEVIEVLDSLPTTHLGKADRSQLRSRISAGRGVRTRPTDDRGGSDGAP